MITKSELDKLAEKYETKEFFYDDPIGIPNRFEDKNDKEIIGFIASLVAYGRREIFIKKLNQLLEIAQNEPYNFIVNFEPKILGDFNYRFGKPDDFAQIFNILKDLYNSGSNLEELFKFGYESTPHPYLTRHCTAHTSPTMPPSPTKNCCRRGKSLFLDITPLPQVARDKNFNMFIPVTDYFYSRAKDNTAQGFKFMIPDARKGSAMKRMCMYLRWMVRKGEVDFGIWNFMPPSELFIPLDTHVARISREMGLLTRKSNDFEAVIELTENLKKFDEQDPVKYDFAIFGYGVNNR